MWERPSGQLGTFWGRPAAHTSLPWPRAPRGPPPAHRNGAGALRDLVCRRRGRCATAGPPPDKTKGQWTASISSRSSAGGSASRRRCTCLKRRRPAICTPSPSSSRRGPLWASPLCWTRPRSTSAASSWMRATRLRRRLHARSVAELRPPAARRPRPRPSRTWPSRPWPGALRHARGARRRARVARRGTMSSRPSRASAVPRPVAPRRRRTRASSSSGGRRLRAAARTGGPSRRARRAAAAAARRGNTTIKPRADAGPRQARFVDVDGDDAREQAADAPSCVNKRFASAPNRCGAGPRRARARARCDVPDG